MKVLDEGLSYEEDLFGRKKKKGAVATRFRFY
jgi:hypothetical protein